MNLKDESFLTIADIFSSLRRHWKLAILCTLLMAVASGAFILFVLRPTYVSEGSLYVRLGKTTLTVDATASTSQPVSTLENRTQEVISVRELVGSRAVAERVANRIGVEKVLSMRSDIELFISGVMSNIKMSDSKKLPEGMTKEEHDEQKDLESAVKYILKALSIDSPKESYIVEVTAKAHDPLVARDIVQFTMEEYQAIHTAAHKHSGSLGFFEEQVEEQRKVVVELENKKRDELNRRNIMSVEAERSLVQGRVTSTTNRLSEVTSFLEGQRARVAELRSQIDSMSETLEIEQTDGIADSATDLIKSSVFALEVEHQRAASIYASSHPMLIQKKTALAEARAIEGNQPEEREQRRNAINPNRMALELEYAKGLGELQSFESQLSFLESDLSELKLREKQLNEDEIFFSDLQRSISIAASEFNAFASKREQSKVTDAIDRQQFSDVNIAQDATLNVTKTGISRMLMFAVCILGATFFGGGSAVARDVVGGFASPIVKREASMPLPQLDEFESSPILDNPVVSPTVVAPALENPASSSPEIASPVIAMAVRTPSVASTAPTAPSAASQGTYRIYSGRFRVKSPGDYITDDVKLDPIPGS